MVAKVRLTEMTAIPQLPPFIPIELKVEVPQKPMGRRVTLIRISLLFFVRGSMLCHHHLSPRLRGVWTSSVREARGNLSWDRSLPPSSPSP